MCPALSKYQFSGYGITTENKDYQYKGKIGGDMQKEATMEQHKSQL